MNDRIHYMQQVGLLPAKRRPFSFTSELSNGLPVDIEGTYLDHDDFEWFIYHYCGTTVYTFGLEELSDEEILLIDNKVINYAMENDL